MAMTLLKSADMNIGLFLCASVGLIFTALVAVVIILINKGVPEINPVDYDWVLLDDAAYQVLAYNKQEFVLVQLNDGSWAVYSLLNPMDVMRTVKLTAEWLESVDLYIERYHD